MSSDTITARREARRRKILENAENRLTKISGNDTVQTKSENIIHIEGNGTIHQTEATRRSIHFSNGGINVHTNIQRSLHNPSENDLLHDELKNAFNENIGKLLKNIQNNDFITEESVEEKVPVTKTQEHSRLAHHISLIFVAVVVRFLFALNLGYLIADSMMVPFSLMTVSRLILLRKQPAPFTGLIRSALLLSGISPQKFSYLMEVFVLINQVSLEFSLYLFTFVAVHVLIGSLRTS